MYLVSLRVPLFRYCPGEIECFVFDESKLLYVSLLYNGIMKMLKLEHATLMRAHKLWLLR